MRLPLLFSGFLCLSLAVACNNAGKQNETTTDTAQRTAETPKEDATPATSTSSFNINDIPVSDKELGAFPFFSFPEGLKSMNKPVERKFDQLFFAIEGKMIPLEGRVWKANVSEENTGDWSEAFFNKSYDDAIKAAGGVKIFDGTITNEEYARYSPGASYLGEDGSIGYAQENIKTYVIRRTNGGDVYIQFSSNNAYGRINILQQEGFKQTITLLKADEISKELNEKGKAVLYINFDTDKATLKPDGRDAVAEIAKALTGTPDLKVNINGYTDNTGNDAHNLQLSKDRAKAVLEAVVAAGIDKSRLSSEGFGSKQPIGDNGTEEGKAKNRRVELVKK
ncbi:MAG: OmpA family protein [Chitinophagaceae bacterium]